MNYEETDLLNKKMKSYRNWLIITVPFALFGCFAFGIIGISIFSELVLKNRVKPAENVDTIVQFAQTMPSPEKIEIAERNGCKYFFVTGSGRVILPSGPPIYVFDSEGNLVIWVSDIADVSENHPWWKYYDRAKRIKEVSLQESIELTAKYNQ